MFVDRCRQLNVNVIVFDGYERSTKDTTCNVKSGKVSQVVEIIDTNPCPSDRTELLTNYANKQRFVNTMADVLKQNELHIILSPSDADTTIVRNALDIRDKPVTVLADDTDVLCPMYISLCTITRDT